VSRGMRPSSVLSEAARNLASGTSRAAILATIFVALVGTVAILDVRTVVDVLRNAAAYRAAGAAIQVIEANDGIDGQRCDRLAATPGIVGSGALRAGERLRALNLPSSELTVWEVTPGLPALLAATEAPAGPQPGPGVWGPGVWLSADLAETLGAGRGSEIATSAGVMPVAGVYDWPDDGRVRDLGYAILAPVPAAGRFDQCWAGIWPVDDELSGLLLLSLVPDTSNPIRRQVNGSLGADHDAAAIFAGRLTRPAPVGALVIGLVLGAVAARLRRLELAAALHARVPKPQLAWQHLIEASAWTGAATVVALAGTAYAAALGNPDPAGEVWLIGARSVAAGAIGVLLGTLAAVAATRERHLFRYFKNR
jgi:hypothetical protein